MLDAIEQGDESSPPPTPCSTACSTPAPPILGRPAGRSAPGDVTVVMPVQDQTLRRRSTAAGRGGGPRGRRRQPVHVAVPGTAYGPTPRANRGPGARPLRAERPLPPAAGLRRRRLRARSGMARGPARPLRRRGGRSRRPGAHARARGHRPVRGDPQPLDLGRSRAGSARHPRRLRARRGAGRAGGRSTPSAASTRRCGWARTSTSSGGWSSEGWRCRYEPGAVVFHEPRTLRAARPAVPATAARPPPGPATTPDLHRVPRSSSRGRRRAGWPSRRGTLAWALAGLVPPSASAPPALSRA